MGLINAMGNWFTNQNEIQRANENLDRYQGQMQATDQATFGNQPYQPQNPEQAVALQNQGWLPAQSPTARSHSPTAFRAPEHANMQAWRDTADSRVQQASDDYQAYLNNPVNKVVDTALDVANLPFSLIGQRFFADPSAKAEKKYKQALDDAYQISGTAQQHYLGQRTARDKTFSDSMLQSAQVGQYGGLKTSGAPRLNAENQWIQAYADGSFKPITDAPPKVQSIGGLPYTYNANTGQQELAIPVDQISDYLAQIESAKVAGTQGESRIQTVINDGYTASQTLPTIKRSIGLLDGIKTGGFSKVQLWAKQAFGIESADEGELSNLLGKAVISQYRQVFGAQFTESEGEKLDTIEAGLGKSTEANIRVLNNVLKLAEKKVKLAKSLAEKRGDQDAILLMDTYSDFDLTKDDNSGNTNQLDSQPPEGFVLMEDANGNQAYVDPNTNEIWDGN